VAAKRRKKTAERGEGGKALIYEITRKSPAAHIKRPGTIQAIIYQSLKQLKRAEVSKIVDVVIAHENFQTKQEDSTQQIRWYLWKFKQVGLVREIPDRRHRANASSG
jgi:hypothetical protein